MYAQFRAQYPMGSLISELLQIHEGKYIVRASVQVGGSTLATGLSAAPTIEQAEDQARARALVVVGIEGRPYPTQAHLIPTDVEESLGHHRAQLSAPAHSGEFLSLAEAAYSPPLEVTWATPTQAPTPFPTPEQQQQLSWFETEMDTDPMPPSSQPRSGSRANRSPQPTNSSRPSANTPPRIESSPQSLESNFQAPVDLSDIIAQTDVELKRLGWSHNQGRRHLEKTYNKRSRQLLTDSELIEFLDFLKTQTIPAKPAS